MIRSLILMNSYSNYLKQLLFFNLLLLQYPTDLSNLYGNGTLIYVDKNYKGYLPNGDSVAQSQHYNI